MLDNRRAQIHPYGMKNTFPHQLATRFTNEEIAALDALRRVEADIPNRAEMLRRLVRRAFEASAPREKVPTE